jgi:hypothetical protein
MGTKITVHVLPQTHYRPDDVKRKASYRRWLRDYQARSQHAIAHTILKTPHAVVFAEGVSGTYTPKVFSLMQQGRFSQMSRAQKLFPKGNIPSKFRRMSQTQKRFMVRAGAARTLFLLGKIKTLHQTEDRAKKRVADNAYFSLRTLFGDYARCIAMTPGTDLHAMVISGREKTVIGNIKRFVSKNAIGDRSIFLIFGAVHNFLKYNTPSSKLKFIIHPNFKAKYNASQRRVTQLMKKCDEMNEQLLKAILYPLYLIYSAFKSFLDL